MKITDLFKGLFLITALASNTKATEQQVSTSGNSVSPEKDPLGYILRSDDFYRKGVEDSINESNKEAVRDFTYAIELDKATAQEVDPNFHNRRGVSYLRENNYQECLKDLSTAIQLREQQKKPPHPSDYYHRGLCHEGLGDYVSALSDLSRAKEISEKQGYLINSDIDGKLQALNAVLADKQVSCSDSIIQEKVAEKESPEKPSYVELLRKRGNLRGASLKA